MNINAPSDETLLAYAAGTLRPGPALLVETHLALAATSRKWVSRLEELGGALLEGLPPVPLSVEARSRALARIETAPALDPELPLPRAIAPDLPAPLRRYRLGPWKWAGPGSRFRRIALPHDDGFRVIILKIDPGRQMPHHTHTGTEFTCVISGSYRVGADRFGPGDFEEADQETSHQPIVDSDVPCVCVAALEGDIKLEGFLGRLLQPFVRV
jgi:putative transcriptional regulator